MASSRGSSWPRDWTDVSYVSCIGRWVPYPSVSWEVQKTCKGHKVASTLIMKRNFCLRRTSSFNSLPGPAETLERVVWQFPHLKVGTRAEWEAPCAYLPEKQGWFFPQRLHTCNSALCFFSFLNGRADGCPTSRDATIRWWHLCKGWQSLGSIYGIWGSTVPENFRGRWNGSVSGLSRTRTTSHTSSWLFEMWLVRVRNWHFHSI